MVNGLSLGYNGNNMQGAASTRRRGGASMRKMTLDEIRRLTLEKGGTVDWAVGLFRAKGKETGWDRRRTRPRNEDERKALDALYRQKLISSMKEGTVQYDPKRRVLFIADLVGSQSGD
jgi:hypothetical protein